MILKGLSSPDKQGKDAEGHLSQIWIRGRQAMRIRFLENQIVMNEYENKRSVRRISGSKDFIQVMAALWLDSTPLASNE